MDPLVLVSLITSLSSMLVSVLTHVRYSKCGFCEVETKDSNDPTTMRSRSNSNSSNNNKNNVEEHQPLIQN